MKIKNLSLTFILMIMVNVVSASNSMYPEIGISDTLIFTLLVVSALVLLMIIFIQIYALGALSGKKDDATSSKEGRSGFGEKATAIVAVLFLSQSIYAMGGSSNPLIEMTAPLYWVLLSLNAFLFGVVIYLYFNMKERLNEMPGMKEDAMAELLEEEASLLMDHDYDGIRELDNNLPPWWKYGFYMTIIVAFIYFGYYHFGSGDLQIAEYEKEMIEGDAIKAAFKANEVDLVDESNLALVTDAAGLADGKKTYSNLCKVCHGEFGEGLVGPNFADKYWKHGGSITDLYNTIKVGVPDKGMISWESTLSATQRINVASYILSFQGTDPANQKAPEGDLWEGE